VDALSIRCRHTKSHPIPCQFVVPFFTQAMNFKYLHTLVLTEDFVNLFSLDFLSLHCPQVSSFELCHDPEEEEITRFLECQRRTLKKLKIIR
jgi:hypothetical protein